MDALLLAEKEAQKLKDAAIDLTMTNDMLKVFRQEVERRVDKQHLKDKMLAFRRIKRFEQESAVKVFTGYQQLWVVTRSHQLWVNGRGDVGQLGFGKIDEVSNPKRLAFVIWSKDKSPAEIGVSMVAVGMKHTIVLTNLGDVFTFGDNHKGQLGFPGSVGTVQYVPMPLRIPNIPSKIKGFPSEKPTVLQIAAGLAHSMILTSSGCVFSFGSGSRGQLGHKGLNDENSPRIISTLHDTHDAHIAEICCGNFFSVARSREGDVWTWGQSVCTGRGNPLGLGNPEEKVDYKNPEIQLTSSRPNILRFFDTKEVTAICAGERHSLFCLSNGEVYATGDNESGQLGLGHTSPVHTPCMVVGLPRCGIRKVAAGSRHSAILDNDLRLWCFGATDHNRLGFNAPSAGFLQTTPKVVQNILAKLKDMDLGTNLIDNLTIIPTGIEQRLNRHIKSINKLWKQPKYEISPVGAVPLVRNLFIQIREKLKQLQMKNLKVQFRRDFQEADYDGSGEIDALEVQQAVRSAGMFISVMQAEKIIGDIDINGDNVIDESEYISYMIEKTLGGRKIGNPLIRFFHRIFNRVKKENPIKYLPMKMFEKVWNEECMKYNASLHDDTYSKWFDSIPTTSKIVTDTETGVKRKRKKDKFAFLDVSFQISTGTLDFYGTEITLDLIKCLRNTLTTVPIVKELVFSRNELSFPIVTELVELLKFIKKTQKNKAGLCSKCGTYLEVEEVVLDTTPCYKCGTKVATPIYVLNKLTFPRGLERELIFIKAKADILNSFRHAIDDKFNGCPDVEPITLGAFRDMFKEHIMEYREGRFFGDWEDRRKSIVLMLYNRRAKKDWMPFFDKEGIKYHSIIVTTACTKFLKQNTEDIVADISQWFHGDKSTFRSDSEIMAMRQKLLCKSRKTLRGTFLPWQLAEDMSILAFRQMAANIDTITKHYISINSLTVIDSVCCGRLHTAVITKSGEVWTCGQHQGGQLGCGSKYQQIEAEYVKASDAVERLKQDTLLRLRKYAQGQWVDGEYIAPDTSEAARLQFFTDRIAAVIEEEEAVNSLNDSTSPRAQKAAKRRIKQLRQAERKREAAAQKAMSDALVHARDAKEKDLNKITKEEEEEEEEMDSTDIALAARRGAKVKVQKKKKRRKSKSKSVKLSRKRREINEALVYGNQPTMNSKMDNGDNNGGDDRNDNNGGGDRNNNNGGVDRNNNNNVDDDGNNNNGNNNGDRLNNDIKSLHLEIVPEEPDKVITDSAPFLEQQEQEKEQDESLDIIASHPYLVAGSAVIVDYDGTLYEAQIIEVSTGVKGINGFVDVAYIENGQHTSTERIPLEHAPARIMSTQNQQDVP